MSRIAGREDLFSFPWLSMEELLEHENNHDHDTYISFNYTLTLRGEKELSG